MYYQILENFEQLSLTELLERSLWGDRVEDSICELELELRRSQNLRQFRRRCQSQGLSTETLEDSLADRARRLADSENPAYFEPY